ncbi:hypothetical protein [Stenotrophomonas pavanii]|uniref:hypothetical protein n=1 Tax=Stenotrophomonas pavanii TaxID=487698 RepID=UPI0039C704D4
MSLVKPGAGKPKAGERALFAASVVFLYGVWENYVEQLAIETAEALSASIPPSKAPEKIKRELENKSAWELSVSPGWRAAWVDIVKKKAVGDDAAEKQHGINTVRHGTVVYILQLAGIQDPFAGVVAAPPAHLLLASPSVKDAIEALVRLRGEIVHTGQVPDSLVKSHVTEWTTFVEQLTKQIDQTCRSQCKSLLASP